MTDVFETRNLTKSFGQTTALDQVNVSVPRESIVGLVGKNGSGKTTLLNHLTGLYLPTDGEAFTLGRPSHTLRHEELVRIGIVPQETRFLDWMTVEQHIDYVTTFYPNWDQEREKTLRKDLELDGEALVGVLSPGNAQKLALVMAVCHHPELLVLDEPVNALDPIARNRLLEFLMGLIDEDHATIIVSSHVLRDIERIVDRVICLDQGHVTTSATLDDLMELYAEWRVTSRGTPLPSSFDESYVLQQDVNGRMALLTVRQAENEIEVFRQKYDVDVEIRPLNLERIFPLLIEEKTS